jgi:hypothetical protein
LRDLRGRPVVLIVGSGTCPIAQGRRGEIPDSEDRMMHMLGPTAYGWEALERGGSVAIRDVATDLPPLAANLWMGSKLRPVLDPVARRSEPLPGVVKFGLGVALALVAARVMEAVRKRQH